MSLLHFLNSSSKPPPATVIRHVGKNNDSKPVVKRLIKTESVQISPEVQVQRAPIIIQNTDIIPNIEEILTFVVLARIMLPRKEKESLATVFAKLICGKLQHQMLSVKVAHIIHDYKEVYDAWGLLVDRNKNRGSYGNSTTGTIRSIVNWFKRNDCSQNEILDFFNCMVKAAMAPGSWVHVFSTILRHQLIDKETKNILELIDYTKDLISIFSSRKNTEETRKMNPLSYQSFLGIDEPQNPFDLSLKIAVSDMLKQNPKSNSGRPKMNPSTLKRYTPSHVKFEYPVSDNQNSFLFNEMTKSCAVSVEVYGRYKPPDVPTSVPVQDFFQIMENIEVNENMVGRIYAFSECNPFAGYCVRRAGKEAFTSNWNGIEPFIGNPKVRDIVINRCRSQLPDLEEEHEKALQAANVVTSTRPTNAFIFSIRATNIPMSFNFPLIPDDISLFILHFLQTNYNSKISPIQHFLSTVISFIQQEKDIIFIHSQTYAGLLWHFSMLCDEIRPLLKATALELDSYEAVLDMCIGKAHSSIGDVTSSKSLSDILKSIIQNRIITDEIASEATKRFGTMVEHVTHFYPIVERMSIACNMLRSDLHMKSLHNLSRILCVSAEETNMDAFLSSKPLYNSVLSDMRLHSLFIISTNRKEKKITLSPFKHSHE